jgi:chromate transporter
VTRLPRGAFARHWQEIACSCLKLGATAYGGLMIAGIIQRELQDKRQWVSHARFLEGVALTQLLPGPGLVHLSTFLGYARGGWCGGVLAGLCFALPGVGIMLALTIAYAHVGAMPTMRAGLNGLGPVVLGVFILAVSRLGRASVTTMPQLLIALAAAVGIGCFYSRRLGAVVFTGLTALLALMHLVWWFPACFSLPSTPATASVPPASLMELGLFCFKVGALTFGGGSIMIALIQDQVVQQWHWLTPQEFMDGLVLGQVTPGSVLGVTAYIGYKVAGMAGAGVAATASYLPSFMLMLAILPVFERVRTLVWVAAAMKGIGPAVSGLFAVALGRMAPHALPDPVAVAMLLGTLIAVLGWRLGTIPLLMAGAGVGVIRGRLCVLPGIRRSLGYICANVGV